MSLLKVLKISLIAAMSLGNVIAQESHTVFFNNNCGFGIPILRSGGRTLSTGGEFTSNGPLLSTIAYLDTGRCGFNGENCTMVETALINGASSTDITLSPPHSFSVPTGFVYFGGCWGSGAFCRSASCPEAFHRPNDPSARVVACQDNNVGLFVIFC